MDPLRVASNRRNAAADGFLNALRRSQCCALIGH